MTSREAHRQLLTQLQTIYDQREAATISNWVLTKVTGQDKTARLIHDPLLTRDQQLLLLDYQSQLLRHRPVQYVLQEAWFDGMALYVDENVLIPRPETEELTQWITEEITAADAAASGRVLLDVGTGSGCMAIALKKRAPAIEVWACDVSIGALQVAEKNATLQGTGITFLQIDFLDKTQRNKLPLTDIIVSNPPYIPENDKGAMQPNVLEYEPTGALFVSGDDHLLFYREIADFAKHQLRKGGSIYTEIHEEQALAVTTVFAAAGFENITVKKDMQGKDRMLRAR